MNQTTLVIWIASAIICYALSKDKEKNVYIAIAMGLLFGIFAVIYYLLAKGSRTYEIKRLKTKLEQLEK